MLVMVALAAAAVISIGVILQFRTGEYGRTPPNSTPVAEGSFVGSAACAGCHQQQAKLWQGSQHQLAMAHATDKSVLGDFSDTTFDYFGVTSRFFRKDGKYLVETDGSDGKLATFEIKYTFGVDPLQQYLVEFADGRVQALPIAWDTRPKDQGGQRWFHLYPKEAIGHDDVLHWTKLNQNWNFMCSECHSTGVRKNYDATNDRYATTFAEISVGCEGCHGQGSRHVDWARDNSNWWSFGKIEDPTKGLAERFQRTTRRGVGTRCRHRQRHAERPSPHATGGGRDLRSLSCPAQRIFRGLDSRTMAVRHPHGFVAWPRSLSR